MLFYDTETCGLHGMPVLLQYAVDDGPIMLYNFWTNPIGETLGLIERFMAHEGGLVGFNLAFDHFQLCKAYTTFSLVGDLDVYPVDLIDTIGILEPLGRDGKCLKPVAACDLMLHARKGSYQSCMDRHDIRIRRVPTPIAFQLADELEVRVPLKDIYFKRASNYNGKKWHVEDVLDGDGHVHPEFKDVVLKFNPSTALKDLAQDALGIKDDDILRFAQVEVNKKFRPVEYGYAPFASAHPDAKPGNWQWTWPDVIKYHIDHWDYDTLARTYAEKDVEYTRGLYNYFGRPAIGDTDSILACMVAAVRWRGLKVDVERLREMRRSSVVESQAAPRDHHAVKRWIWPLLSEEQRQVTENSTDKVTMEELASWKDECECLGLGDTPDPKCEACKGTGLLDTEITKRSKAVIKARTAEKEVELYDKLIQAGRFHASFKVIGALSGRMAGADGLNPQGIKKTKDVRRCFPMAWEDFQLCGGDFDAFEVSIAVAVYNDPKLTEDLKTGKKIHGLFGQVLFPEETYDSIIASSGTENDMYTKSKSGLFSSLYGGTDYSLIHNLGIREDVAVAAMENWGKMYKGVALAQRRIHDMFKSMRQPEGLGKKIYWHDPADSIATLLGFNRYYTLENAICKVLFDLGNDPPQSWKHFKAKVTRRSDRGDQTQNGAARSALFGAAFALQSANVRSAGNHEIQGTGAGITKEVQRKVWDVQPNGINDWIVMPINIHDEILSPVKKGYEDQVKKAVDDAVESYRPIVPLIGMEWNTTMNTWADK